MKNILLAFFVLLISVTAQAQSISPTAEEFGHGKAKGFFTVTNRGLQPLQVTAEAATVNIASDGQKSLSGGTPTVTIRFKNPRFTLGPRASKTIDFQAECVVTPCHFSVIASFVPLMRQPGLTVAYHLGGSIYICDRQKACRKNTLAVLHASK